MTIVEFDIVGERVVVTIPGAGWSVTMTNAISSRPRGLSREIVAVGSLRARSTDVADRTISTQPAFEPASFDPELAEAFIRFGTGKAPGGGWWLLSLSGRSLALNWPHWREVPADGQRRFLSLVGRNFSAVAVNGTALATRGFLRWLSGRGPRLARRDDAPG
jgi:hypothetical protein